MIRRTVIATALVCVGVSVSAGADVVLDWNTVYIDNIRATGGPPCPISRAGAMVHAAMFDAVNSIDRGYEPYLGFVPAPPGASMEASAATAAYDVMVSLFPARAAIFRSAYEASLADIPDGHAEEDGITVGHAAAAAIMLARANDGTSATPIYIPEPGPGNWIPTFPDFTQQPFDPGWGATQPWVITDGAQFRPRGPLGKQTMQALLHQPGYADQVNEVKSLGSRNSTMRTPYETETAFFWANDINGTYKPPGHLNYISQVVSLNEGLSLQENARLFALINIGMADAGLVAWDCKYRTRIDLWRPITAIRMAHTDGNHRTTRDANWEPLNPFSPPFPAYISGHATFGAVHAAIMADFFGTDYKSFTIGTDDPLYTGGPRSYNSFSSIALENGRSRVFLGVHYTFDATDGYTAGSDLGHYVFGHTMRPRKK